MRPVHRFYVYNRFTMPIVIMTPHPQPTHACNPAFVILMKLVTDNLTIFINLQAITNNVKYKVVN